jgi:hypothetical protein
MFILANGIGPVRAADQAARFAERLPSVNHNRPPSAVLRHGVCPAGHEATAMRIMGSNATVRAATASAPRRAASGGFSIAEGEGAASTSATASLRTIGGIDALMALQGQDDPAERRRRAVKRGRLALDVLDQLKVEVLEGTPGPSTLMRLRSATAELMDGSGDAGLDQVLAEIELRLEVEIAKMAPR